MKIKIYRFFLTFWMSAFLLTTSAIAQDKILSGMVKDESKAPIPGVNIVVKGTTDGTITDGDGKFSISVSSGSVLEFSAVGYASQEITVANQTSLEIVMKEDIKQLSDVVVTALGVERSKKTLSYSTQEVSSAELNVVKDANFMNSMTGKVSGLSISRTSGGVGGSVKLLLRGQRSIAGNNAPLIVIDGVPVSNFSPSQASGQWEGKDGGDGLSTINPEDIESVNILKGASAAALYGSDAGMNGAIMITTKKGKAGQATVNFSSNFTTETPLMLPEFQNSYGQENPQAGKVNNDSWSATKLSSITDNGNYSNFFDTGTTLINNISISGGTEKSQSYFSYSGTNSNGILPSNNLKKHNFMVRSLTRALNERLTIDAKASYVSQAVHNRPPSGYYFNPLTGLYMFPRDVSIKPYLDNYEKLNSTRGLMAQDWPFSEDYQQNPAWILNRNQNDQILDRLIGTVNLNYDFNDWLSIQARGNLDRNNTRYEQKVYATTQGTVSDANGRYRYERDDYQEAYGDLILSAKKKFEKFSINAFFGLAIKDRQRERIAIDTKGAGEYVEGLIIPNSFSLENIGNNSTRTHTFVRSQTQSQFGSLSLGYKDMLYLDITERTDWDSNLPVNNYSFFYPSVGLTAVISEMVTFPETINLLKLRATYAEIGNSIPVSFVGSSSGLLAHLDRLGQVSGVNTTAPFDKLKPEISKSIELGLDSKFFNERLSLDFTYYKSNTINQFINLPSNSVGSKYSNYYVNAGDVQNEGFEGTISYIPIKAPKFTWNTSFNLSRNINTIISLHEELKGKYFINGGGADAYTLGVNEGGSFGDLYSYILKPAKDGGIYGTKDAKTGVVSPTVSPDLTFVGQTQPQLLVGFRNDFTIGRFNVSLLLDSRFGGKFMSMTQAFLNNRGVSKVTGEARDNGGYVKLDVYDEKTGNLIADRVNAKEYYTATGGRGGALGSECVYDATNIRVRELSIGYQIPIKKVFKAARISFVGRNLFFLYNNTPYDPEMVAGTGNTFVGIDVFGLPPTRSMGFNLNLSF